MCDCNQNRGDCWRTLMSPQNRASSQLPEGVEPPTVRREFDLPCLTRTGSMGSGPSLIFVSQGCETPISHAPRHRVNGSSNARSWQHPCSSRRVDLTHESCTIISNHFGSHFSRDQPVHCFSIPMANVRKPEYTKSGCSRWKHPIIFSHELLFVKREVYLNPAKSWPFWASTSRGRREV